MHTNQLTNTTLRKLFEKLAGSGELVFAMSKFGCAANIVGDFKLVRHNEEDRLDMGDGTNHIHMNWSNINKVKLSTFHHEGVLIFCNNDDEIFRLYRMEGLYDQTIIDLVEEFSVSCPSQIQASCQTSK